MARSLLERLSALQKSVEQKSIDQNPIGQNNRTVPVNYTIDSAATPSEHGSLGALSFQLEDEGKGPFYHRALHYDLLTVHGSRRYVDIFTCELTGLERVLKVPMRCETLRFYDTETTGLGTGAGTFPFLHAVAEMTEDELVIHQYFVEDFSQEYAVLHALMTRHFTPEVTVVSFNGKSFDWPLLQSRLLMYRMNEFVGPRPHADLLYPSRRLWKQNLERVSLSNVESQILLMERTDDLPGKEAPGRYFQYTDCRDASLVEPVFSHNASDVCTLVILITVMADILSGRESVGTASEYLALAGWYDEWREHDLAERCYEAATMMDDADWRAYWKRSQHHKRKGDFKVAVDTWQAMLERFSWTVSPAVELAKYAEHREKAYEKAEQWTRIALARVHEGTRLRRRANGAHWQSPVSPDAMSPDSRDPVIATLEHRLKRILLKQERTKSL